MTFKKTDEDLKPPREKTGPEVIGDVDAKTLAALRANYPNARAFELLPSGSVAVRFRRKKAVYIKRKA
ncbi:MAG TPA: hypothetical protein VGD87_18575 [Archangium sp.]